MKISELIAILQEFPEDWEVRVPSGGSHDNPVGEVKRGKDRDVVDVPEVPGRKAWRYYDADAVNIYGKYPD